MDPCIFETRNNPKPSKIIHRGLIGVDKPILPQGGLETAAAWNDEDLTEFLDFLVPVKLSYQSFV